MNEDTSVLHYAPYKNFFFLLLIHGHVAPREQLVDTLFKLTIVKFFGFKAKSVRKSLTAGSVESSIFSSLEIPHEVPQCSTKSSRFQSPTVNRVFRVAAGTTNISGKKGLKTTGRVRASSKGMSLLTSAVLFLLCEKFEAKEFRRGEKLQVFANGPRRWNQSFVDGRLSSFLVCSNVTYFLPVLSMLDFRCHINAKLESDGSRSGYFCTRQALICFY